MNAAGNMPCAGERFMIGVPGTVVTEGFRAFAKEYGFSDFILFAHNCVSRAQMTDLAADLHAIARHNRGSAALIALDQEGGRVQRLPKDMIDTESAKKLALKGTDAVHGAGAYIAETMRSMGFNVDLAPVLDIDMQIGNSVIGDRSFGCSPDEVTKNGLAMMEGIRSGGVLPCAKHFPGHGGTAVDTHISLPSIDIGIDELEEGPLKPFAAAIAAGVPAVMSAHIVFPKIEKDVPATMSKTLLTGLLREKMGFDGLIITDDLEMGAVATGGKCEDAALGALRAGADLALVSHDIDIASRAAETVARALRDGSLCALMHEKSVSRKLQALKWLNM